jgi:hypothetical protein
MGSSEWNNMVKKVYDENKHKKGFGLGDAMKLASKLKKSGKMAMPKNKNTKRRGGSHKKTKKPQTLS